MKKHILITLSLCLAALSVVAEFTPVRLLEGRQPAYPKELAATGEKGEVKVRVRIDETGAVTETTVVSATNAAFEAAALAAVQTWKFQPAEEDGKPVAQLVEIPLLFKLPFKEQINAQAGRELFVDIAKLTDKVYTWKDVQKYFNAKGKNARIMAYPGELKGSGISEEIEVRIILSPEGLPLNPNLVNLKHKELAIPAILHVARMRFEKPKLNGQPIYLEQKVKLVCEEPKS